VLRDALTNADCILAAAKADQQAIVQALKMNDVDHKSNSDALEMLRWYITPKECATYLSQGFSEVSGTCSPEISGGLRPLVAELYLSTGPREKSITGRTQEANTLPLDAPMDPGHLDSTDGDRTGNACFGEATNDVDNDKSVGKIGHEHADERDATQVPVRPPKRQKTAKGNATAFTPSDLNKVKDGFPDFKNETKKPSREMQAWGRGKFVQPQRDPSLVTQPGSSIDVTTTSIDSRCDNQTRAKTRHVRPPAKLMRHITQAVIQWSMLEEGDKLLLGLSGGKDSLSLLHCLLECQRKLPIKFTIEVCTIDPMTPSFDPSPLIPYVESLGLKYHYIRENIVSRANMAGKDGQTASSLCAYCARMKRGNLYTCARDNGCNKLVLAQHLDDCAESFLMSVMHNGFLRTMKAHYQIDAGDLAVIRPMVYCRESLMTAFAKSANLPVINENCPACFEEPKERARVKKLLSREESLYPHCYDNIRRSLIPLMHNDLSSVLRRYTEEAVSKSRKEPPNGTKHQESNGLESQQPTSRHTILSSVSEEELLAELARRKAAAFSGLRSG
jgi:tRNA(Ile)-lysidine synthase TilS/MesJ